ncbi:hypothetical protein [Oscillibacter sp.]|uniref:hypothetical protein n=1 Tax=Oscillibacter sp. TaxID=1945593 RepID=UPI0028986B71|nr:hypothetical protein [Oscillibacter sp.]
MERFVFDTTQGAVLEAAEEAALMDWVRVRSNATRASVPVGVMAVCFTVYSLVQRNWEAALFTVLLALIIIGFFWLPMQRGRRFRMGVREARARWLDLTDAVRARPMRFVFEGDDCRMLDGKGEEIRLWKNIRMGEVRESDLIFWIPAEDTSVLLHKSAMAEGSEEAFRQWLKARSKRYRVYRVTERLRRSMERE